MLPSEQRRGQKEDRKEERGGWSRDADQQDRCCNQFYTGRGRGGGKVDKQAFYEDLTTSAREGGWEGEGGCLPLSELVSVRNISCYLTNTNFCFQRRWRFSF